MNLKQLMSKRVVTVAMDDSLKVVQKKFDHTGYHHLLVTEDNKLCGIVSDRDFLKALSPNLGSVVETTKDLATLDKKVHQIMTRHPITINLESSIYDAISVINHNNISCVPVVDDAQVPIGIVTWRDVLKAIELRQKDK